MAQDYMHLIGAEKVERAAATMQDAAESMIRASSQMDEALYRQRVFLDEWMARFEKALTEAKERHE